MSRVKGLVSYLYKHHLIRYLFVGGTTFIIDEGLLILLHGGMHFAVAVATFFAYVAAFVYNFTLNRWWTFSAAEAESLRRHIVPYSVLFAFNLVFTVIAVSLLSHVMNYALAKPLVVIVQTTWNYYIYKNVIFVKSGTVPPLE
ncbi:MAG TPA: GtrA family protein [Candidatus Saccharimonadales bacterium]|nr:GtrA family protein [Candidatus Saccharimonadales bacterium]